jgi:RNA polymerase sigma-70 factor, ECF subfamily
MDSMVGQNTNPGFYVAEVALARAAGEGDPRANRDLAERLLNRIRATVYYLAAGDRDADDLVQMALVAILRSARTYRGDSSLERWGDRIAVRTALRELKRRRWRERIVALDGETVREGRVSVDHDISRRLLRERLALLLGRLSVDRRTAVTLHWMHGYSVQEIADLTSAPVNTVRDRLRTGKKKLKSLLEKDPALRDWARSFIHESKSHESQG